MCSSCRTRSCCSTAARSATGCSYSSWSALTLTLTSHLSPSLHPHPNPNQVAGLGRCAGLPLNLSGMPYEVVSMARHACRGSGPACRLDAARPRGDNYVRACRDFPSTYVITLGAGSSPPARRRQSPVACRRACQPLPSVRAARTGRSCLHAMALHPTLTGGGPGRQDVRSAARQRRLGRGAGHLALTLTLTLTLTLALALALTLTLNLTRCWTPRPPRQPPAGSARPRPRQRRPRPRALRPPRARPTARSRTWCGPPLSHPTAP